MEPKGSRLRIKALVAGKSPTSRKGGTLPWMTPPEMRASRLLVSNCLQGGKSYTPHESAIPKLLIW
jgi:hypothetical protein